MKTWIFVKNRLASAAIIFLAANTASIQGGFFDIRRGESAEPEPQRVAFVGAAQVREATGIVERLSGVDQWEKLQAGEELLPGDVVRTAEGTAVLRMRESKSFVKITPHTTLRLIAIESGWDRAVVTGREERTGFVVRSCRGKAYVIAANGEWRLLRVNDVLAPGTALRTSSEAVVDLFHNASHQPLRVVGAVQLKLETPLLARVPIVQPTLMATSR